MTVAELIAQLSQFDGEMTVYVPDFDGTTQPAKRVEQFPHLNRPRGIAIPDDIWILPWIEGDEPHATESWEPQSRET